VPLRDNGPAGTLPRVREPATRPMLAAALPIPESDTIDGTTLPEPVQADCDARWTQVVAASNDLIAGHWPAVEHVAEALERRDRIDHAELDRLIAISMRHMRPKDDGIDHDADRNSPTAD
jgi:hypothetical protein